VLRASRLVPAALLAGLLIVVATSSLAAANHLPFGTYSRDVKALCDEAGAQLPDLAGAMGLVNMMVWVAAGSTAVLAAALWPPRRRWLLAFAALVLLLALDDAMLLHEEIGPELGLPEKGFYLLYVMVCLLLLVGALRPAADRSAADRRWSLALGALAPSSVAFLLGAILLGVSVIVDQATHGRHLAEDAPKLLGSLVWLTVPVLHLPRAAQHRPCSCPVRSNSETVMQPHR